MSQPPAKQSSGISSKVSKFVHVYNNTVGILDCNYFVPNENPKLRPVRKRVKFTPGNNRILRSEWNICLQNDTCLGWTKERQASTPDGHRYPLTMLQLGKVENHDKEIADIEKTLEKAREGMGN